MEFEKTLNPVKQYREILNFVFKIYQSTSGKYPRLEWLEKKPSTNDFKEFAKAYGQFLRYRLENEFDEMYIMRDYSGKIIATFALVYMFQGKDTWWIPEDMRDRIYLEFFMVSEKARGQGIGKHALDISSKIAESMKRKLAVVTFEDIKAYNYYVKQRFKPVRRYKNFVILER